MATLEQAYAAYEAREYDKIPSICEKLISSNPELTKDALIIWAKSLIKCLIVDSTRAKISGLYKQVLEMLIPQLKTFDDVFKTSRDLCDIIEETRVEYAKTVAARLEAKPDMKLFDNYPKNKALFLMEEMNTHVLIRNAHLQRLAAEMNLTIKEVTALGDAKYKAAERDEKEIYRAFLDSADNVFDSLCEYYEENDYCNAQSAETFGVSIINTTTVIEVMYSRGTPQNSENLPQLRLEGLLKRRSLIIWRLNTYVHFSGQELPLIIGTSRNSQIEKLRKCENDIKELDPQFVLSSEDYQEFSDDDYEEEDDYDSNHAGSSSNQNSNVTSSSSSEGGAAIALGILGIIFAWVFALFGHILSIIGIVMGAKAHKQSGASGGLFLSIIGETCAIVSSLIGMASALS